MKWHVVCKELFTFSLISKYSFSFPFATRMSRGKIIALNPDCVRDTKLNRGREGNTNGL